MTKPTTTQLLNKVPQITAFFWIIKVLCTTVGETAADFLNSKLSFGLTNTSILMTGILAIVLFCQFRQSKYVAAIYWSAVVLLSVVGTLITDNLTDNFGVPLPVTTVLFSIALGLTLYSWYRSEKTLSIHSITTTKRETFYWLTILFTFALGTASGDLMAEYLGIGYLGTGLLIAGLVTIIAFARRFGLNSILAFWTIYILTRPLGASIGDYLSQPTVNGGLGLGTTITSIIFLVAILICVVYLTLTKKDQIENIQLDEFVEQYTKPTTVIIQTIIMILIFVVLGGVAFVTHQSQIKNEPQAMVSSNSTLGNLNEFKVITSDTLDLIKAGKIKESTVRITDLESLWDKDEPKLKPMNLKDWTKLDGQIDTALKAVRATPQNPKTAESTLVVLSNSLNIVDPQDK
jgi:uncharacterized membrane-anchored protein